VIGDDHPDTLGSMGNLAGLYLNQSRFAEAEPLYVATLETQERVLGDDHPDTLGSMDNLAILYLYPGRYAESERIYLESIETQKRVLGEDHPRTALTLYGLACLQAIQGERVKAMERLRQSIDGGLSNADWMAQDSDLETLHGSEFDRLVERARENAAKQQGS